MNAFSSRASALTWTSWCPDTIPICARADSKAHNIASELAGQDAGALLQSLNQKGG